MKYQKEKENLDLYLSIEEQAEDDGIPNFDPVLLWRLEQRKKKRMLDQNSITTNPCPADPALVAPTVSDIPKTDATTKEGIVTWVPLPTKGANSLP